MLPAREWFRCSASHRAAQTRRSDNFKFLPSARSMKIIGTVHENHVSSTNRAAKRTRFLELELGALYRARLVARLLSSRQVATVGPSNGGTSRMTRECQVRICESTCGRWRSASERSGCASCCVASGTGCATMSISRVTVPRSSLTPVAWDLSASSARIARVLTNRVRARPGSRSRTRRRQACFASYGPPQSSGPMNIDPERARDARSRTTRIRAATATTTLSVFAFRTSFHAHSIRLRRSAIGVRTGSSVLIGMANAPRVGCRAIAGRS
jgi:hypothetical protein